MMQELKPFKSAAGSARVISMVVLVVILVCGYVALDFYTGGQQNASMVEGRGGAIVGALSGYKRETGGLPDVLDRVPADRRVRHQPGEVGDLLRAGRRPQHRVGGVDAVQGGVGKDHTEAESVTRPVTLEQRDLAAGIAPLGQQRGQQPAGAAAEDRDAHVRLLSVSIY